MARPTSPYSDLPEHAFWRSGVATRPPGAPAGIYTPKFRVTRQMQVVTAGSCFAQHVGRALRQARFEVVDTEPLPPRVGRAVTDATAQRFGYRLYSARYGNIYTARQLLQLDREARGEFEPAELGWDGPNGRIHDSQRPGVEPEGYPDLATLKQHRAVHLEAVREAFDQADLFVFTFGLTEAWEHIETGTIYPTAPGVIAGSHDPAHYRFRNFGFAEVLDDFFDFRERMMERRPDVKFVVTVSPVPLTATASGDHVEVATTYSKSVLRAVCGELAQHCDNVDYMPSYEIITSQAARAGYYMPNLRNVRAEGVAAAMQTFLGAHGLTASAPTPRRKGQSDDEDLVCEEALLEAFGQ